MPFVDLYMNDPALEGLTVVTTRGDASFVNASLPYFTRINPLSPHFRWHAEPSTLRWWKRISCMLEGLEDCPELENLRQILSNVVLPMIKMLFVQNGNILGLKGFSTGSQLFFGYEWLGDVKDAGDILKLKTQPHPDTYSYNCQKLMIAILRTQALDRIMSVVESSISLVPSFVGRKSTEASLISIPPFCADIQLPLGEGGNVPQDKAQEMYDMGVKDWRDVVVTFIKGYRRHQQDIWTIFQSQSKGPEAQSLQNIHHLLQFSGKQESHKRVLEAVSRLALAALALASYGLETDYRKDSEWYGLIK